MNWSSHVPLRFFNVSGSPQTPAQHQEPDRCDPAASHTHRDSRPDGSNRQDSCRDQRHEHEGHAADPQETEGLALRLGRVSES